MGLPTEMAHYACDCWDAEIFCSHGWLECVGIADRSAFDLTAHARAAKVDLEYKETLDKPITKEGRMVKEWLEALPQEALVKLKADVEKGPTAVEIDGRSFTLEPSQLTFETKVEKITVNSFTPGVIEPSFGIDRIFTAILDHVYYARPKEADSDDKQTRGCLGLAACIAPYKCAILPLDQRITRHEAYASKIGSFRSQLSALGLSYTMDESGATIGRRYARNDELGTPFAVTVDHDFFEDGTATLHERDTMWQIRLPLADMPELILDLCKGETTWEAVFPKHPH